MKRIFGFVLSFWALLGFAVEGGNSSGGDQPYGAPTIPFQVPRSTLIGVVDGVTPGTATWTLHFARTLKGSAVEITVRAPRFQMETPAPGDLVFLRGAKEPYAIGNVIEARPDWERALVEYMADPKPESRLAWAETYSRVKDTYLPFCAIVELRTHAQGNLKGEVLALLLRSKELQNNELALNLFGEFLPHPSVETFLKGVSTDTTQPTWRRSIAARQLMWVRRYRALVEAWKDGREGADKWLQEEATRVWEALYKQPSP